MDTNMKWIEAGTFVIHEGVSRQIYGTEICHDCNAKPGENHEPGCDVELCSYCGCQWISCGHKRHKPDLMYWTGVWPGERECAELGWYHLFIEETCRWFVCSANTPGARLDLNRWHEWLIYHTAPIYPLKTSLQEDRITQMLNRSRKREIAKQEKQP